MLRVADTCSLIKAHFLRHHCRKFGIFSSLFDGAESRSFLRRSFASAADEVYMKKSLNPAAAFHFASTDFTSCFVHVPRIPNVNETLRTLALNYLKDVFDPLFWFDNPVRTSRVFR